MSVIEELKRFAAELYESVGYIPDAKWVLKEFTNKIEEIEAKKKEESIMKYRYFFSYIAYHNNEDIVYGNIEMERDTEICCYSDIQDMQNDIAGSLGFSDNDEIVITNWRLF